MIVFIQDCDSGKYGSGNVKMHIAERIRWKLRQGAWQNTDRLQFNATVESIQAGASCLTYEILIQSRLTMFWLRHNALRALASTETAFSLTETRRSQYEH
jgi:hypothetical protein